MSSLEDSKRNQGELTLSDFQCRMNAEILSVCKRLPISIQDAAAHFLFEYAGAREGVFFDFMAGFPRPLWSILFRLPGDVRRPEAQRAHAMALFLHSLDDHLSDGQLGPSHMLLQLRSEAWCTFESDCRSLEASLSHGFAASALNDYFQGITNPQGRDLVGYMDTFRKQCSTWTIAPALFYVNNHPLGSAYDIIEIIQAVSAAFRIIDDIEDCIEDCTARNHSGIYYALDSESRRLWDTGSLEKTHAVLAQAKHTLFGMLHTYFEKACMLSSAFPHLVEDIEFYRKATKQKWGNAAVAAL